MILLRRTVSRLRRVRLRPIHPLHHTLEHLLPIRSLRSLRRVPWPVAVLVLPKSLRDLCFCWHFELLLLLRLLLLLLLSRAKAHVVGMLFSFGVDENCPAGADEPRRREESS